jgi:hypothetical protein
MTSGHPPFGFLQMPQECPPLSSGCPGSTLYVAGRRNPTFRRVFSGFSAISGRYWTQPEVYGSWDGWPPNSRSKYLYSQKLWLSAYRRCPHSCPLEQSAATRRRWTSTPEQRPSRSKTATDAFRCVRIQLRYPDRRRCTSSPAHSGRPFGAIHRWLSWRERRPRRQWGGPAQ